MPSEFNTQSDKLAQLKELIRLRQIDEDQLEEQHRNRMQAIMMKFEQWRNLSLEELQQQVEPLSAKIGQTITVDRQNDALMEQTIKGMLNIYQQEYQDKDDYSPVKRDGNKLSFHLPSDQFEQLLVKFAAKGYQLDAVDNKAEPPMHYRVFKDEKTGKLELKKSTDKRSWQAVGGNPTSDMRDRLGQTRQGEDGSQPATPGGNDEEANTPSTTLGSP